LTLGADRPIDERQWYADLLQAFRQSFPGHPQLAMHIGLVVRQVQDLDEVYLANLKVEDEIDLTDLLERS
jgi:hypothetical protein